MIGERNWHGANFEAENEREIGTAPISKIEKPTTISDEFLLF